MFKKEPQYKALSNLRNSDKKKLISQINNPEYKITTFNNTSSSISYASFDTFNNNQSGIVYTILDNETNNNIPIWFEFKKNKDINWLNFLKENVLVPTVYTCWNSPDINLVPTVITNDFVLDEKILGSGANLMNKGCWVYISHSDNQTEEDIEQQKKRYIKGQIVGVSSYKTPKYIKAVGVLCIDYKDLIDENKPDVAVKIIHWLGDGLCKSFKCKVKPPRYIIDYHDDEPEDENENGNENVNEKKDNNEEGQKELEANNEGVGYSIKQTNKIPSFAEEVVLRPEDIDEFLQRAMYYTLTQDKLELPITSSNFVSNHLNVNLPKRVSPQDINVKKSSFKKIIKLLKHWEKQGFMKLKSKGGDYIIINVASKTTKPELLAFDPYPIRGRIVADNNATSGTAKSGVNESVSAKKDTVKTALFYKPTSNSNIKSFLQKQSSKELYTQEDIKTMLDRYITENNLVYSSDRSKVLLDDNLYGIINSSDSNGNKERTIPRSQLLNRVISNNSNKHLLAYYQIYNIKGEKLFNKPQRGNNVPKVQIVTEVKIGRKIITKVIKHELYGIDSVELAKILKVKCNGSATIQENKQFKCNEVIVQGSHESIILDILNSQYGLPQAKFIQLENKTGGKRKKK
ncbi:related to Translation machinery-associated protein 64 [Saccharomycodes ludwigii]|uniref:Related to Translation machinery-associated protein 64 n=1 Tax=Saccharomycodes ludwigii TaxID=36035 RepID=A0A376B4Z2_9ASCO|nr:hypothetical protein SCDLUD_001705 [Saccharomycodes ludwigii]KAH3901921.1 hypothetical protein SCDLUD_001705 [Saccharomycodes ludwigii]SSD59544.1 related to Translation machinery-associated protein 64 [Saccharomycodes ludwigii]